MLVIGMALIENQRQPIPHLAQAVAQAQDDQRRSDCAAFVPGVADASRHTGHQLDQPFLLGMVDLEYGLHYGWGAMAHTQQVVQTAGPVEWFLFRAQVVLHRISIPFNWSFLQKNLYPGDRLAVNIPGCWSSLTCVEINMLTFLTAGIAQTPIVDDRRHRSL